MELTLIDTKLKIENIRRVRMLKVHNYATGLKYHFSSGAIEVGTYYARRRFFHNFEDFIVHILAFPYMAYDCYKLPSGLNSFELEELSSAQISELATGSFQTILDFSRNSFLKISLSEVEIGSAYKLKNAGVGQTLFFETPSDYICIYEDPID